MADQTGPRCGNNPNFRMSDGDRKVVEEFQAFLTLKAAVTPLLETAAWVDGDPLMEVIAHAVHQRCETGDGGIVHDDPRNIAAVAALVARAAEEERPLSPYYRHEACGFHWHGRDGMDIPMRDGQPVCPRCEIEQLSEKHKASIRHADKVNGELMEEVQRYAEGTERPVLWSVYNAMHLRAANAEAALKTFAALFEGFARLLATSSRDWGQYAPDAWLWAVICGWDCEETQHDETCTHGAMKEMQQRHGWSGEAVEKARRYRAAVRALTESAAEEEQRDLDRRQAAEEPRS